MASLNQQKFVKKLLKKSADIKIDGNRPWDIKIYNNKIYDYLLTGDTLLLGEAYMDKKWDCDQIDEMIYRILVNNLTDKVEINSRVIAQYLKARVVNEARKSKAFQIGQTHYDIGNNLYEAMLDSNLVYTCGYWKTAKSLEQAQIEKMDLVCKKIGLQKNQKILDIGGGWGSFAKYAATKYKAKVINITVSKEQVALADQLCSGLPVKNRLQDYRDVNEKFDHIVSLGMFEHVGYKNYRKYFEVAEKNLNDNGIFLLHTIGNKESHVTSDAWAQKYIFPNSMLPSLNQITKAIEGLFLVEDIENFGAYYDKTLMYWYKNFIKNWPKLSKDPKYDERFFRMWKLYLLTSAASFRARQIQLWQIILSKKGVKGGYQSIR